MTLPRYVRRKKAKGLTYYYFDTGQKNERGKPVLLALPDVRDPGFGRALQAAQAQRTKRGKVPEGALTVRKLIALYERSSEFRKLAPSTQQNYSYFLGQIADEMGDAPLGEVEHEDVTMLMDARGDRPSAANQIVRVLGALYAWGRKKQRTDARPTEGIDLNETGEHEPWPEPLIEAALKAEDETVSLAVALLYFTAQRLGDVVAMRWTDIRAGRIAVVQEKTGTSLEIAIHAELRAHLERAPRRGFTILSYEDGRKCRGDFIRRRLQAFAADLGHKVVPHGLRKNAVNSLLEVGCSTWEVQAISGQSPQVIEHYAKRRDKTKLGDAAILRWNGTGK